MTLTPCPDDGLLLRLLSGRLPAADAGPFEEHLSLCPICGARAGELDDADDLLGLMRGHTPPDAAERDALARIAARAARCRLADAAPTLGDGTAAGPVPSLGTVELPGDLAEALGPPRSPDEVGRLGPIRILGVLGMGGMGMVFRAEREGLGRPVALKVIHPALAGRPDARPRFLREVRALAALDHPNVVPLYSAGEEGGLLYLEMPLLRGETLADRLAREGRLPAAEAARLGRALAAGLAAAHAAGLVHRDLKPGNVWLAECSPHAPREERPSARLFDFGLVGAAPGSEEPGLTAAGALLGTPGYLSPEQVRGEPADARSDLFALGCVLYEACVGVNPFRGESAQAELRATVVRRPPPLDRVDAGVPRRLSGLVTRLLEKEPADRPASAVEVAEELGRLEAGRSAAPPPGGKGPAAANGLLAVLLLLNAGGLLAWGLAFGGQLSGVEAAGRDEEDPGKKSFPILTDSGEVGSRSPSDGGIRPPADRPPTLRKIMSPTNAPRIRIEDLPALEALTEEEMAQIFGAGKQNRAKLNIEALEGRELLAAQLTASLSGGVLRVEGTPGNDLIRILQNDGLISVEGIGIQSNGATLSNVNASAVQRVIVDGLAGDDHVWLGDGAQSLTPSLEVTASGGMDVLHSKGTTWRVGAADGVVKTVQSGDAVYALLQNGRLVVNGQQIGTGVKEFQVAGGRVVWAEGANNDLYEMPLGGTRRCFGAGVKQWAVASETVVFVEGPGGRVDAPGGTLFEMPLGGTYHQVSTEVKEFQIADGRVVWVEGAGANLYEMPLGGRYRHVTSGVKGFQIVDGRVVWVEGVNSNLYEMPLGGSYRWAGTGIKQWAVAGGTVMWVAGPGGALFQMPLGGTPRSVASGVRQIVPTVEGVFGLLDDGRVLKYHPDGSSSLWNSGDMVAVAPADHQGSLYLLDRFGVLRLYHANGDGSAINLPVSNGTGVHQIVATVGGVFGLTDGGKVLKYHPDGSSSVYYSGDMVAIAAADRGGSLYSLDRFGVLRLYRVNGDGSGANTPVTGGAGVRQIVPTVEGVFGLLEDGRLLKYHPDGSTSVYSSGDMVSIAPADLVGSLYYVDRFGVLRLWRFSGDGSGTAVSVQSGTGVRQIVPTVDGVFGLTEGGKILKYHPDGSSSVYYSGDMVGIAAADRQGSLYSLDRFGVLRLLRVGGASTEVATGVRQIVPTVDGVFGLTDGGKILKYHPDGSSSVYYSGDMVGIAPADRQGSLYSLDRFGVLRLYRVNGGSQEVATGVKELATTDRGVYVLREGDKVDFVNPDGSLINELGFIRDIAVAGGQLYALRTTTEVFHHLGGVNNYRQIGSHGITTADGAIWYLGTDGVLHILDAALGTITDKVNGFTLSGDIARKWLELGGPAGTLGLPKSSELSIPGGTLIEFERGAIGAGSRGVFAVWGDVWIHYRGRMYELGVPTRSVYRTWLGSSLAGPSTSSAARSIISSGSTMACRACSPAPSGRSTATWASSRAAAWACPSVASSKFPAAR